jgi:hypothetical protein
MYLYRQQGTTRRSREWANCAGGRYLLLRAASLGSISRVRMRWGKDGTLSGGGVGFELPLRGGL